MEAKEGGVRDILQSWNKYYLLLLGISMDFIVFVEAKEGGVRDILQC